TAGAAVSLTLPGPTALTVCQVPPAGFCSRDTPCSPRTTLASVTCDPYATGAAGCGGVSASRPTVNHVERRPAAARTDAAGTARACSGVVSFSWATRPAGLGVVTTSVTGPVSFNALRSVDAVTGTGPQSWYGDSVSYGSGTDTRYGIAVPVQSALDSVSPPDVDEK